MKKIVSLFTVVIMLVYMTMPVYASTNEGALYNCSLTIGSSSSGITVTYDTNFTETASEIGCKDIVLYEKVNGSWNPISLPSVSKSGSKSYAGGGTYTGAVKGRTYKVSCTHYAVYQGKTYTLPNDAGELVYN